eukprot:Gregarina_sp_Poly_1__2572@NODE_1699_length_3519_cov_153_114137_g590_i1_p5_GENE_NODE_1699_length_3519_cov_153_114137_g590_i1NODE_1699_length_3519_cov_153_114137_g590_i1_p5_ORF_typecomplete_len125_score11_81FOLN/PF09289_10/0_16_NODE_1699_length_3519_cov_153_114137_g590_i122632637
MAIKSSEIAVPLLNLRGALIRAIWPAVSVSSHRRLHSSCHWGGQFENCYSLFSPVHQLPLQQASRVHCSNGRVCTSNINCAQSGSKREEPVLWLRVLAESPSPSPSSGGPSTPSRKDPSPPSPM